MRSGKEYWLGAKDGKKITAAVWWYEPIDTLSMLKKSDVEYLQVIFHDFFSSTMFFVLKLQIESLQFFPKKNFFVLTFISFICLSVSITQTLIIFYCKLVTKLLTKAHKCITCTRTYKSFTFRPLIEMFSISLSRCYCASILNGKYLKKITLR